MATTVDAQSILSTRNLIEVGVQADDVRRRMHGTRTTFVRVVEIHVDAPLPALPPGVRAGELRIVGRPVSVQAAVEAVARVNGLGDTAPVTGFSLSDLEALASGGTSLKDICRRLRDAGLAAIAEVPLDGFEDSAASVAAAREAGVDTLRLTVHAIPPGEEAGGDPRIALVERARTLQDAVGGFKVFAPLPRTMSIATPTTGYDDVKLVALARLVVTNVESIQVDWPLYGPKLAQVALTMGADDVDGVAAIDAGVLGTRRSPLEEIRGNIRAAALEAVERDGRFRLME